MRRIRYQREGELMLNIEDLGLLLMGLIVLVAFQLLVVVERLISTTHSRNVLSCYKIRRCPQYEPRCLARTRTGSFTTSGPMVLH